jgi:hypothetical protein
MELYFVPSKINKGQLRFPTYLIFQSFKPQGLGRFESILKEKSLTCQFMFFILANANQFIMIKKLAGYLVQPRDC